MRKKYRIKTTIELEEVAPLYIVQAGHGSGFGLMLKSSMTLTTRTSPRVRRKNC